jgi:hypothetical protein
MIKHFCDLCHAELTPENMVSLAEGEGAPRLTATHEVQHRGNFPKTEKVKLTVQCMTSMNGTSNKGIFCKYCIIDTINKADDRPREDRRV